jgi:hypothetical protein
MTSSTITPGSFVPLKDPTYFEVFGLFACRIDGVHLWGYNDRRTNRTGLTDYWSRTCQHCGYERKIPVGDIDGHTRHQWMPAP